MVDGMEGIVAVGAADMADEIAAHAPGATTARALVAVTVIVRDAGALDPPG